MSTLQVRSSHKYLLVRFFQKFREAEDEFRQAVRSHLVTWLGWKTKMESIRTTYQEFQIENLMVFSMVDLTCKSWTPKMVDIQYQKSYFSPCGTEKNCFSSALWRPSGVSFERNAPLTHQVICKKSSIPFTKLIWVKGMLLFLQMTWCVRWRWKVCLLTDDVDVFSMER